MHFIKLGEFIAFTWESFKSNDYEFHFRKHKNEQESNVQTIKQKKSIKVKS